MTKQRIGKKEDAEKWQIGNKYIETGYRIGYDSHYKAFMSLFELHNETGNVWSHLIGCLVFVWFTYYVTVYMQAPVVSLQQFDTCPLEQECSVADLIRSEERQHLEPSPIHSFLNSDVEFVEMIESSIRYSLVAAHESLAECTKCLSKFVSDIPSYLNNQIA